jgi:hypothetical protein
MPDIFAPFDPSTDFNVSPNIKLYTNLYSGSHIYTCSDRQTDRQTGMMKLIGTFHDFCELCHT